MSGDLPSSRRASYKIELITQSGLSTPNTHPGPRFQREIMKRAKDKIHCVVAELDYPEFEDNPQHKRQVMIEENPQDGQERRIFFPILGRNDQIAAETGNASIFWYRYKPYVDIEWYIDYLHENRDIDMYVTLCFVRDDMRHRAESKTLKSL